MQATFGQFFKDQFGGEYLDGGGRRHRRVSGLFIKNRVCAGVDQNRVGNAGLKFFCKGGRGHHRKQARQREAERREE